MRSDKSTVLVFALFFVSGITGLVYEVAWTRMLITVFGSTTYAVSTVLAAFMGGLALGSIILGKFGDRLQRPVLAYGILEILIGIYAVLMPSIIGGLFGIYSAVFEAFGQQPLPVTILRFLLTFLVILIPTTLMGGTLPILSKFAGREFARIGKNIGGLYALNTFGAVIGSFMTGFVLLEFLGVSSSVYLAAVVTIMVGITAFATGRKPVTLTAPGPSGETAKPSEAAALPRYTAFVALLAIGISGGAALAYEVIYTKVLVFSLGASAHAFSLMLTTFLIGIALGSLISSRLADRSKHPAAAFGSIEIIIGLTALASIYLLSRLDLTRQYLDLRDAGGDLFKLRGGGFLQAATILLVPAVFMGAAFPFVTRIYARKDLVSSSIGRIYFFNTIGAVAGSLIAGFVLVPLLGSARSIAFIASFNIAAGVLLFSCGARRKVWAAAAPCALIVFMIVASLIRPAVFARTFNIKEKGSELLYFKEGVSGTVTVHRYPGYDLLAIDGVNVAGTSDMLRVTQKLQGHLPILLAPGKDRVAHIGFGSGETLRILTLHGAHHIDGIEICRDVISVAKRFFSDLNRLVFDRPEVHITIMDGKNFVLLTQDEYDIIMTDSIYPGAGGASALYTYDHFMAVRDKLKTGGIASCWLPLDLSREDMQVALKAFSDAFPDMAIWYCYMTFSQHALLVGKKDGAIDIDLARFVDAFEDSVIREDFRSILIDDPFTLISCFFADGDAVREFCGDAPRHSDDHPVLEFGMARRGSAKPYLSTNLEELLALRPNPLPYVTNISGAGMDSAYVAREVLSQLLLSSNIIGGHVLNAHGEAGRARAQYEKALSLDPENRIATYLINTLDTTLGSLETAARTGQGGYQAAYSLGVRYLAEGKFEESLRELERALSLRPDLPDPYVTIGEWYMRQAKPERAAEYLVKANDLKPGDDGILVRLGLMYHAVGKRDEAKTALLNALKINPNVYEARIELGAIQLSEGDLPGARQQFENAEKIAPSKPMAVYNLGLTYEMEHNWTEAVNHFRKALAVAPTSYLAHFHLGNALYGLGDVDAAIREWETTLSIRPDHPGARENLSKYRR
ncbi:MAG: fused MFS/spermidine synthase [Candidatus Eisenbacteria bacterium]